MATTTPLSPGLYSLLPATAFAGFNLSDNSSRTNLVVLTNIIFLILTLVFVGLRLWSKCKVVHKFQIDDGFIIAAMFFTTLYTALVFESARTGLGQHIWTFPLEDVIPKLLHIQRVMSVSGIAYSFALTMTKLSILTMFVRIFPVKWFRTCAYVICFIVTVNCLCFLLIIIFECTPWQAGWNFTLLLTEHPRCVNIFAFLYGSAGINIATDVAICLLPIPIIFKLRVRKGKKIVLVILFGLGILACLASILRTLHLNSLQVADYSFAVYQTACWSIIELAISIWCACIPGIKPLIHGKWSRLFDNTNEDSSASSSNNLQTIGTPGNRSNRVSRISRQSMAKSPYDKYEFPSMIDEDDHENPASSVDDIEMQKKATDVKYFKEARSRDINTNMKVLQRAPDLPVYLYTKKDGGNMPITVPVPVLTPPPKRAFAIPSQLPPSPTVPSSSPSLLSSAFPPVGNSSNKNKDIVDDTNANGKFNHNNNPSITITSHNYDKAGSVEFRTGSPKIQDSIVEPGTQSARPQQQQQYPELPPDPRSEKMDFDDDRLNRSRVFSIGEPIVRDIAAVVEMHPVTSYI